MRVLLCVKIRPKFKSAKLKICFYGFVGNVYADLGLPWFSYRASFDPSRAHFRFKNMGFFHENDFFWMYDKSAGSGDNNEKILGKLCTTYFDQNP